MTLTAKRLRGHVAERAEAFHQTIPDRVLEDLKAIPGVRRVRVGAVHDGRTWAGLGRDSDRPLFVVEAEADHSELRRIATAAREVLRSDLPRGVRYRMVVEPATL